MRIFQNFKRLFKVIIFLGFLSVLLLMADCKKEQAKKENKAGGYSIGVLLAYDSPSSLEVFEAIKQQLEDYQKKSGQKLNIIVEKAHGQVPLLSGQAARLASSCKLLVPISTPALQAAMINTTNVPIVFASVANPYLVRAGRTAVDHEARVTGVCSTAPIRQVIELVRRILPQAKKIGTIWTPSEINSEYYLRIMEEAGGELGLEIISQPISGAQDIVQAVQHLVREKIDAFFPVSDNTINANFDLVVQLSEESNLPLFSAFTMGAEFGALASMGFDYKNLGTRTAELIIRIIKGESPARIPFQYIDRIRFYLNEEQARKLGIKFPPELIKRADGLIKRSQPVNNMVGQGVRRRL
ncbi:MAG: ABC transporter substrate-binding protein [Candidatus Saccharicenans sp.]